MTNRQIKRAAIRDLFKALGGNLPTRELALRAREAGIWSDDELSAITLRELQAECRRALADEDERGLPFAQPVGTQSDDEETTEAPPIWRQLDLFSREDLFDLIAAKRDAIRSDHRRLMRIVDYCRARFGDAPAVPEWD